MSIALLEEASQVLREQGNLSIAKDIDSLVAQLKNEHPLVRCECKERFTYCDLGNHYCPSCGESGEGALQESEDNSKLVV